MPVPPPTTTVIAFLKSLRAFCVCAARATQRVQRREEVNKTCRAAAGLSLLRLPCGIHNHKHRHPWEHCTPLLPLSLSGGSYAFCPTFCHPGHVGAADTRITQRQMLCGDADSKLLFFKQHHHSIDQIESWRLNRLVLHSQKDPFSNLKLRHFKWRGCTRNTDYGTGKSNS
jgi:hypothetical protein